MLDVAVQKIVPFRFCFLLNAKLNLSDRKLTSVSLAEVCTKDRIKKGFNIIGSKASKT